jgi:Mn-dependent DtxR family transcriptional regulator
VKDRLSAEEFVRLWQRAESLGVVAARMGVFPSSASSRASRLRREGVLLKYMPGGYGETIDIEALKKIVQEES